MDQTVLVVDLHHRHGRILRIGQPGIRIAVGEQLPGVLLLRLQMRLMEKSHGVGHLPIELVDPATHAVTDAKPTSDQQIQIRVNAVLAQLGDEVIQPVQRIGVPVVRVAGIVVDQPHRAPDRVEKMEPHHVEPELGHPGRDLVGRVMVGKTRARREITAKEPQPLVAGEEMARLHAHATELAGRTG